MLRKIVATVVTVLLAATIAAPAQATGNNTVTEWHTWKIPVDCPKALDGKGSAQGKGWEDCAKPAPFPQAHIGKGQLVPPCGVWYQQDKYTGKASEIKDVIKDGILSFKNGTPEDSKIVKEWKFVYGGDCIEPQPKDKVEKTDWQEQPFKCGDTKVTSTREVTTTSYKLKNGTWVLDTKNSTKVIETTTRDVTKAEKESCKPAKPNARTGKEKLPAKSECVVPQDGTKTVTEWARDWTQDYTWDKKKDKWVLGDKVYGEPYVTTTKTVNDKDCAPAPLSGTTKFDPTYKCVEPANGKTTVTYTARDWTQAYSWNKHKGKWELGNKVYGESYVYDTKVVAHKDCAPPPLTGTTKIPPTYECVEPANGKTTVTYTAKDWTQAYTWNKYKGKWELGNKVYGESYVYDTKVVAHKDCAPPPLTGTTKIPPTYECVEPANGKTTVTYTAKDWTQAYTWNKYKGKWELGNKVYGESYVYDTKVVAHKDCAPPPLSGTKTLHTDYECVTPAVGKATVDTWATDWTQGYTWDKRKDRWVLDKKVYGEPYIIETTVVDDESCLPERPEQRGIEQLEPELECVVPANGKAVLTSYEWEWTREVLWDGELLEWILGDKVFGERVVTDTQEVDDADCNPVEPTLTAEIVPQCIDNVPFVNYEVTLTDPDGQSTNTEDLTLTYLNTKTGEGNYDVPGLATSVNTEPGTYVWKGTFLWPGATYSGTYPEITGTNWPGWKLEGTTWIGPGADNYGWTLGGVDIYANVNPNVTVSGVVYPTAAFPCTPLEPVVEVHSELPAPPAAPVTAEAQYAG